jgi:CRISPR-associated protein Cas5d
MNERPTVSVKVWADYACFTRPELKVERLSYPIMTPSAARGVLDAILFKPQMRWHVRRITILEPWWLLPDSSRPPYRLVGFRRNEIQGKIAPRTVASWMSHAADFEPYLVDSAGRESAGGQNRTQRNTLALKDVAYLIHASPLLTKKANRTRSKPHDVDEPQGPDTVAKYVAMFQDRVAKGRCFHRPYLGCREFACNFALPDGQERFVNWSEPLGLMLYDIRFGADFGAEGQNLPGYFEAQVKSGVLHCDTQGRGPHGEDPITVFGWPQEMAS